MRPEKFATLLTLHKNISKEGTCLDMANLENLQYMNIDIIKIKPNFSSWVSHVCTHNELIREIPGGTEGATKIQVRKIGRLSDCSLWLGVCPNCLKHVIGIQRAVLNVSSKAKGRLYKQGLTEQQCRAVIQDLNHRGIAHKATSSTDGYNVYIQ